MLWAAGLRRVRARAIGVAATGLIALAGCDMLNKEFRQVAGPAVQSGVTDIVNGLLDGVFAVIDPDTADDTGT